MGTFRGPFSALRYRDIQKKLSQSTLAQRASVRVGQAKYPTLEALEKILETTATKEDDLYRGTFALASRAAERGQSSEDFTARTWPRVLSAMQRNSGNPIADESHARRTFDRAITQAFAAVSASELAPRERAASSHFAPAVSMAPSTPNFACLSAVAALLKQDRLTLAAKVLASHGFSGRDALLRLEVAIAKHKIDPDIFAAAVDEASRMHEGPAIPFDDFDVARYMSDINESVAEKGWLYVRALKRWASHREKGWELVDAEVVWSEVCQLSGRIDLRRKVDEPLLLSAQYVDAFACEYVATLVDSDGSRFSFDATKQELRECVAPLRDITPKRSLAFEAWIDATTVCEPETRQKLNLWLAACHDLTIDLPALILHGPTKTGKSEFAHAVSRLWSELGSVARASAYLGTLSDQGFNGELVGRPIVFADEALPVAKGTTYVDVDKLKEAIPAHAREITKKGQDPFTLRGANRLIIAINEPSKLHLSPAVRGDANTVEALGNRSLIIDVRSLDTDPKIAAQKFKALGLNFRSDEIAAHCCWLHHQHAEEIEARRALRSLDLGNGEPYFRQWATEAASDGRTADAIVRLRSGGALDYKGARYSDPQTGYFWVTVDAIASARRDNATFAQIGKDLCAITGRQSEQKTINGVRARWHYLAPKQLEAVGCVTPEAQTKTAN